MSDLDDRVKLQKLLRVVAVSASEPVSEAIERRLREACRARAAGRRRSIMIAACIAACLLLALGWQWRLTKVQRTPADTEFAGFMALPYAQSDVPIEQMVIVRVDLDDAGLRGLGLPQSSFSGRKRRRADLLIGQDGMARAVRFAQ